MIKSSLSLLLLIVSLTAFADHDTKEVDAIAAVLDGFHDAAKHGDKQSFLGSLTENGVFMGTDEWERWPRQPELTAYVGKRFKDGKGWDYRSVARNINVAESGDYAWFDEVTFSEKNGRFRGTGVLQKIEGKWKIAHYAMSFIIPNDNWEAVSSIINSSKPAL